MDELSNYLLEGWSKYLDPDGDRFDFVAAVKRYNNAYYAELSIKSKEDNKSKIFEIIRGDLKRTPIEALHSLDQKLAIEFQTTEKIS